MRSHFYSGVTIAGVVGGIDQLSKWFIVHYLGLSVGVPLPIAPLLDFRLIWNRGISYGWLDGQNMQAVLIVMTSLLTLILLWMLAKAERGRSALGLALIIGGALGNIADRAIYGAVVDFISLHFQNYYWYIFNVADVAITIGVVIILWDSWRTRKS